MKLSLLSNKDLRINLNELQNDTNTQSIRTSILYR